MSLNVPLCNFFISLSQNITHNSVHDYLMDHMTIVSKTKTKMSRLT